MTCSNPSDSECQCLGRREARREVDGPSVCGARSGTPFVIRTVPKSRILRLLAMIKPTTSVPNLAGNVILLDVDPGRFRYSIWSNVSISVWAGQANLAAAERVLSISKRIVQEHPEGHSTVVFILTGAPAPTPEAAAIFGKLYDPANSKIACMGVLLEGEGFWASVMRSTFTRLRMAAPGPLSLRVCENTEELLDWLPKEHVERTGVQLDRTQFMAALRTVRASATNGE